MDFKGCSGFKGNKEKRMKLGTYHWMDQRVQKNLQQQSDSIGSASTL